MPPQEMIKGSVFSTKYTSMLPDIMISFPAGSKFTLKLTTVDHNWLPLTKNFGLLETSKSDQMTAFCITFSFKATKNTK